MTLLRRSSLHRIGGEASRFVLAGAINTLLTFALYQGLIYAMSPEWSYAISWLFGVAIVVLFYPKRVFREETSSVRTRAALASTYVAVFLLGLAATHVIDAAGVAPRLTIFAVMVVTTCANFLLGRAIVRPQDDV